MSGNSFEPCFNMPSSTPWACPGAPLWALASTCEHACSSSACRMPCLSTRITKCPPGYALVNHVGHGGPLELFQPAQIWAQICGRSKHARIVFLIAIKLSFGGNLWQNSFPFHFLNLSLLIDSHRLGPEVPNLPPRDNDHHSRSSGSTRRFPLDWTVSYMPSAQEQLHNPYNPNALSDKPRKVP